MPNSSGEGFADYVLFDDAHQILNIINDYVKKNGGTCFRIEEDELSDMITMYVDTTTLNVKNNVNL